MGSVEMAVDGRQGESWTDVMPRLTRLITDLEAISGVHCRIDISVKVTMAGPPGEVIS